VNYGDGTPTEALVLTLGAPPNSPQNTRASFTLTHTYAHAGNFNLTVTATDKDGATTPAFPWTTMAPDPHAKYVPHVAQISGKLYVHGFDADPFGNQSSFVPRLSIYDPASNTWTTGASPSLVRAYASVGVINGKLYIVGGCVMSDCNSLTNVLEIYDPATNQWSLGQPMPTVRFAAVSNCQRVIRGRVAQNSTCPRINGKIGREGVQSGMPLEDLHG
jgi:N-acetylneuraminic acid mutarotase